MPPPTIPSPASARMPSPHFLEDCPAWAIPNTPGWVLQGHSVAGERTGFAIPSLRLFFDAGMNTYWNPAVILLTHSHSDHTHNIPCIAMGQNGVIEARPLIVCPNELVAPLQLLARASQALNDCRPLGEKDEVRCRGVAPGEKLPLPLAKANVEVEIVRTCHPVPSVGFIVAETVQQLRPEYRALADSGNGKALAALRKAGTELNETITRPRLAFLTDTTIDVFTVSPEVLKAPVIVIECTFFRDEVPPAQAKERGHNHWADLEPVVRAHPTTTFVLIHFSRRFADADVTQYFISAAAPPNVVLWLASGVVAMKDHRPPDPPPDGTVSGPEIASLLPPPAMLPGVGLDAVPLFLLAGQSNMAGRAAAPIPEEAVALQDRVFLDWCNDLNFPQPGVSGGWRPLQAQWCPASQSHHFGPEMTLAVRLAPHFNNRPLYFIKFALGSTRLDPHWHPQASGDAAYFTRFVEFVDRCIAALRAAGLTPQLRAMFWLQGEGDTGRGSDAAAYTENFMALIGALRDRLDCPALSVVASEIRWHHKRTAVVNAALHRVAAAVPNVRCCLASTAPLLPDGHLGTEAVREAGELLAAAYLDPPLEVP